MKLMLFEHDWAEQFEAERQRLLTRFPHAFVDIQHIGSTSVPGLRARPVVDLLAGVPSMAIVDPLLASLCRFGYRTSASLNLALTGRRLLVRRVASRSCHHLHLVEHGGPQWRQRLEFRDVLRHVEGIRSAYDEVKLRWVPRNHDRHWQYSQAKSSFITRVLEHA